MALTPKTKYAKGYKTKKLVLNAALELISSKGFQNVTVDEICAKCNVTKGAFYHHFSSKESILDQLHIDADKQIEEKIPEILKKPSSLDLFSELSYLYAQMTVTRGVEIMKQKFRNNLDSEYWNVSKGDFYNPQNRPLLKTYAKVYNELQESGQVSLEFSFEHFFHFLIVTYDGVVLDWCYNNGSYDLPSAVQEATKRYVLSFKMNRTRDEAMD